MADPGTWTKASGTREQAHGATCGGPRIKLRTPGPQTTYRVEIVAILVSATQADEEDEICPDNASAVGSSEKTLGAEATGYDIHAQIDRPAREKRLTVRWVWSHRDPAQATSYADYLDRVGNQTADELANEGGEMHTQEERTREEMETSRRTASSYRRQQGSGSWKRDRKKQQTVIGQAGNL